MSLLDRICHTHIVRRQQACGSYINVVFALVFIVDRKPGTFSAENHKTATISQRKGTLRRKAQSSTF